MENWEITQFHVADDFTLAAPATVQAVRFWTAAPKDAYRGSITWTLFSDANGAPGAALHTGAGAPVRTYVGLSPNPTFLRYREELDLGGVALGPGRHWIGLHNGPLDATTFDSFFWLTTAASPTLPTVSDNLTSPAVEWQPSPGQYHVAFTVFGAPAVVPEPATWGTLGAGLAALGGALGARRRAARA